jgi:hypothetical protein
MMQFEKIVPNPYGGPNIVKLSQGVLIPGSCNPGDLALLRTEIGQRCPNASLAF